MPAFLHCGGAAKEQQSFFAAPHSLKADAKQKEKAQKSPYPIPERIDRKEDDGLENEAYLQACNLCA